MAVKKTTAKVAAETKATAKTTPVMTEEVKKETATAKRTPVKRAAAKKEAAAKKTTAAKTAEVKEIKKEASESVYVQFMGAEYSLDEIRMNVKKAWMEETGKKESDIEEVQIYIKPEENAAYYVVNGEFAEGKKVSL